MFVKYTNRHIAFADIILVAFFALYLIGSGQHNKKYLFLLFSYLIVLNIRKMGGVFKELLNNWPLMIVIIWCFITSLWSIWPSESRYTSITQVLLLLTCVLITRTYSIERVLVALKWASALFIIINLFYFIIFPGSSFSSIGATGITGHKNAFGLLLALSIISILAAYQFTPANLKRIDHWLLILASVFLLASFSKTSILLLFLSVFLTFLFKKVKLELLILLSHVIKQFSWLFLLLLFSIIYSYQNEILDYLYYQYNDDFLTGRGRIWMTMILNNVDSLNFGLGFGSVWDKGEYSEIFFTDIYDTDPLWAEGLAASDGGYTDLLLALGLVGTGVFFNYLLLTYSKIITLVGSHEFTLLSTLFIFTFLHNITETSYLLGSVNIWFLFVLISCMANYKKSNYI